MAINHPIKMYSAKFLLIFLAGLSGCAVFDSDLEQDLDVRSIPTGATCKIEQGNKATWRSSMITGYENLTYKHIATITAPATVEVPRGEGDLRLTCHLDGYKDTVKDDQAYQSIWVSQGEWRYATPVTVIMDKL